MIEVHSSYLLVAESLILKILLLFSVSKRSPLGNRLKRQILYKPMGQSSTGRLSESWFLGLMPLVGNGQHVPPIGSFQAWRPKSELPLTGRDLKPQSPSFLFFLFLYLSPFGPHPHSSGLFHSADSIYLTNTGQRVL